MSSVVGEITVVGSSTVAVQRRRVSRESNSALVIRDYAPVTPDRSVVSRSVSNGNHVTLGARGAVRLRVLVRLEGGAEGVELWLEGVVGDAIRRGGGSVEARRLLVVVQRACLRVGWIILAVRTVMATHWIST